MSMRKESNAKEEGNTCCKQYQTPRKNAMSDEKCVKLKGRIQCLMHKKCRIRKLNAMCDAKNVKTKARITSRAVEIFMSSRKN